MSRLTAMQAEGAVSAKHSAQKVEGGSLDFSDDRRMCEPLADNQPFVFVSISEQAIMPDFHKAGWQYVHEEAADEFKGVDGHRFPGVAVFVVAPLKRDIIIVEIEDAVV